MSAREVTAWAWGIEGSETDEAGNWVTWEGESAARSHMFDLEQEALDREEPVPKMRVVKLVPYNPSDAAVLKAAAKWARGPVGMNGGTDLALEDAVVRREKSLRGKR